MRPSDLRKTFGCLRIYHKAIFALKLLLEALDLKYSEPFIAGRTSRLVFASKPLKSRYFRKAQKTRTPDFEIFLSNPVSKFSCQPSLLTLGSPRIS